MPKIPLGLQLYSVHKEFSASPLSVMRAVKEMGYSAVEFAGNAEFCPEFYAALLKETNLVCCGWHTPWAALQADKFEETVKLNQAVGNKYVIVPGLIVEDGHQGWLKKAEKMNEIVAKLSVYGMRCGYHSHAKDFELLDGKTTWDTFIGNTSKKVVMQLDTGNALAGSADVIKVLNDNPGRSQSIHLKPYSCQEDIKFAAMIGEDDVPWQEVMKFCLEKGDTEWAIVEYEDPSRPALEAVNQCLQELRKMGW